MDPIVSEYLAVKEENPSFTKIQIFDTVREKLGTKGIKRYLVFYGGTAFHTIEDFDYIVANGADPYADNGNVLVYVFIKCCKTKSVQLLSHILNNYNYDINHPDILIEAFSRNDDEDNRITQFMLDSGCKITDDHISLVFAECNVIKKRQIINMLLKNGVSGDRIARLFCQYIINNQEKIADIIGEFYSNGVQIDGYLREYFSAK